MGNTVSAGGAFMPKGTTYQLRETVTTLTTNGPIVPIATGIIRLAKPSAAAMVLRAPTTAEEGVILTLTNGTAFAHVITATGLLQDGVTGGAKGTITMAAFIGASITLMAVNRQWYVQSINAAPVT